MHAIFELIKARRFKELREMLGASKEVLVNKIDEETALTPLMLASALEYPEIVGYLASHLTIEEINLRTPKEGSVDALALDREDVVERYAGGMTALLYAIKSRGVKTAKILLDNGADPNVMTDEKITPLALAAAYGCEPIVDLLLAHREINVNPMGSTGSTALHSVAGSKVVVSGAKIFSIMKKLVDRGCDIGQAFGDRQHSPLIVAAACSNLKAAKALLELGADPNAMSSKGATALVHAIWRENNTMIELLLEYGAVVKSSIYEPLIADSAKGALNGGLNLLKRLLKYGITPPSWEPYAQKFIQIIMRYEDADAFQLLMLAEGGAINYLDEAHQSELIIWLESRCSRREINVAYLAAIKASNVSIARRCVALGADIGARREGLMLLRLACEQKSAGDESVMALYVHLERPLVSRLSASSEVALAADDSAASFDDLNKEFFDAVEANNVDLAKLYAGLGADLGTRRNGMTALRLSLDRSNASDESARALYVFLEESQAQLCSAYAGDDLSSESAASEVCRKRSRQTEFSSGSGPGPGFFYASAGAAGAGAGVKSGSHDKKDDGIAAESAAKKPRGL